ncbi:MAG: LicD family protein [Selenomonadaceae bacterium]|nr:LicD family protein [Selenomonadaceae bacterium]MDY3916732.1 LicD family protein [Selenomonadaceae bacterium]
MNGYVELSERQLQLRLLTILEDFKWLCQKYNLHFSLFGGTMLGAVRHQGFIPWDDDIDVAMPRPDYERLKTIFSQGEINGHPYLLTSGGYPFLKLFDLNTRFVPLSDHDIDQYHYLWIDIFPLDGFSDSDEENRKIIKKFKFYRKVLGYSCRKIFNGKSALNKIQNFIKKFITLKLLWCLLTRIIGEQKIANWIDKQAQKYPYEKADYIGCVSYGLYGMGECMKKSEAEILCELDFEGQRMPAFSCWDSYLHGIYGDYMVLPPLEKRGSHSIRGYARIMREGGLE